MREETPFEMEERHVQESFGRLDRQKQLVARMLSESSPFLEAAQKFLTEVEEFHEQALAHLEDERARLPKL